MRTQTEKYLEKIQEQIEHNNKHMAIVRKEVYPKEYGRPLNRKDKLALQKGTQAYVRRNKKLEALKRMEDNTHKLLNKYAQLIVKYEIVKPNEIHYEEAIQRFSGYYEWDYQQCIDVANKYGFEPRDFRNATYNYLHNVANK